MPTSKFTNKRAAFHADPNSKTALAYFTQAMEDEENDNIGDDDLLNTYADIRRFLESLVAKENKNVLGTELKPTPPIHKSWNTLDAPPYGTNDKGHK